MEEVKQTPPDEGRVLLVNKPYQWTSFDVVNKLRYILKMKKIGHAGTLDPLATGLLIICTGKKTKQIESFMGLEKEYTGEFILGQSTPSYDLETPVCNEKPIQHLTNEDIHKAARSFLGEIDQIPPAHSAIRVGGKRSYALARQGKEIELQPRRVTIKEFEINTIQLPVVTFRVVCSKGTYIRSLARDMGNKLGTGAYLTNLCRTRIGPYLLADASEVGTISM